MSIEVIKSQIDKFLSNETPEVMAIKGSWGIGKTYSWNKFLKEAQNSRRIKLEKYSYVSLFGINSLDAFKYAIFEQAIDCNLIGTEANIETFKDNVVGTSTALGKKGLDFLKSRSTTHAIESLAFLSLSNIIICIDDLERKGKGLDIKDVLGLVSLLKEQKKCKVILLLNDGEEGLEDYIKYREKVIDFELEFSPTAEESAEIAFDDTELNDYVTGTLKESTVKLNIRNIRILKKIERLIKLVIPYLDGYEQEITHQVVHSLTLFSWCYYCHKSDGVPSLDFVTKLTYFSYGIKKEDSDEEKSWKVMLRNYGYKVTDELDLLLSEAVKTGYCIEDEIKDKASKKNKAMIAKKSAEAFYSAWDLYHDSFEDNQNDVVITIYDNFRTSIKYIAPRNLDETVCFFRELGENDKADEIINFYIDTREEDVGLFNLNGYSPFGGIKDKLIVEKFNEIYQSSVISETAQQVLERISGQNGWNEKDEIILSSTSVEQYYNLFKSIKGEHQRTSFINTCLTFGQFTDASAQKKEIAARATEALKRIAKESPINKSRVALYGIQLDDE
jgi:hypothetical protein